MIVGKIAFGPRKTVIAGAPEPDYRRLYEENKRLREALQFYAEDGNWTVAMLTIGPRVAKKALKP